MENYHKIKNSQVDAHDFLFKNKTAEIAGSSWIEPLPTLSPVRIGCLIGNHSICFSSIFYKSMIWKILMKTGADFGAIPLEINGINRRANPGDRR